MLQRVSLQMFKYSRNTLPEVIRELFITNDTFHPHNTRNKNKLRSIMSNREYMYKNFSFIGVYIGAACREQRSCEPLLGGFGGMLPQEFFLKWCNFVRFEGYFQPLSW